MSVSVAGRDIKGTINGESATGKGQILTGNKGTRCVEGLSVRFRPPSGSLLNGQADPETGTSSIPKEGILVGQVLVNQNSLRFQTGGNQNQTVSVSVNAVNTENLGRGIENTSGFNSLMDINLLDFESAQDSLKLIDNAIDQITSARGDLGAFQKNTLESNLSNLRIAHENLTSSESVIRDVDMAKEMAEFTRNQIMTEAATAMLAQANQLPNSVLTLLG